MKLSVIVASTTHLDRHYERFDKGVLDANAKKINRIYMPYLLNHDFDKQIGVVLYGKVSKLSDGEFALFAVVGEFEEPREQLEYVIGKKNQVYDQYKSLLDEAIKNMPDPATTDLVQPKVLSIAEQLAIHLDSTKVSESGEVYKIKRYIDSVDDLNIDVYPADHPGEKPGHFHVISKQRKINARFDIDTLELMSNKQGSISNKDVKKIQNFFKLRPDVLKKLRSEHSRLN